MGRRIILTQIFFFFFHYRATSFHLVTFEVAKYIGPRFSMFSLRAAREMYTLPYDRAPSDAPDSSFFARSPLVSGRYGTTWLLSRVHSIAAGTHGPGESIEVRVLDGATVNPHVLSPPSTLLLSSPVFLNL